MKKVMLFGTFDIVHMGHIHMFKEARGYGDYLITVVGRDKNVEKIKGEAPLHTDKERAEFLKHIKLIDQVMLGDSDDPYKPIKDMKPDVIALGYDQRVYVDKLEDAITQCGLSSHIVRLRPYEENRFKSSKLKKYIERVV